MQEVVARTFGNRLTYYNGIGEPLGKQSGLLNIDEDKTTGNSNVTKLVEEVTTCIHLQKVTQLYVMNGPKVRTRLDN